MSNRTTDPSSGASDTEQNARPGRRDSLESSRDESNVSSPQDAVSPDDRDLSQPPLPDENLPPLPNEAPPGQSQDDGWDPVWDEKTNAFYFYNRHTQATQWENPRVPIYVEPAPPGVGNHDSLDEGPKQARAREVTQKPKGGYDPSIHGNYDPNADYAKVHEDGADENHSQNAPGTSGLPEDYAATGAFNRFTGKWQAATLNPEVYNDDNKSRRQMNAFFDVDAAANTHDGRSLKAERSGKKLSKAEVKAFKDKRRERKEEKRRAWLLD